MHDDHPTPTNTPSGHPQRRFTQRGLSQGGLTRRRLLAAGATAGVLATAGCLGTRDGSVPDPVVTDDRIDDGWRLIESTERLIFEESIGPITVRALERTDVYEHVGIAEAIADTFDAEGSPVTFFAARIDLRPALDSLPGGVGREHLMDEVRPAARAAFREQLTRSGLANVERVNTDEITVDAGHDAVTYQFEASFDLDGETELEGGTTATISDAIEIEAQLGVWHDGTDMLLAGGTYPTEPISAVLERAVPDMLDAETVLGDALEPDTKETLETEPETFAEEIDALLVSVE